MNFDIEAREKSRVGEKEARRITSKVWKERRGNASKSALCTNAKLRSPKLGEKSATITMGERGAHKRAKISKMGIVRSKQPFSKNF